MKIHTVECYNEMDFGSPERTAEYFRLIYLNKYEKKEENEKKEQLEKTYNLLSKTKKYVVNNLMYDLLPDTKKDKLAGLYFEELLKSENMTYTQLAVCIAGYIEVSRKCSKVSRLKGVDCQYVKSKLQRLRKSNSTKKEDEVIKLTASYFNISPEVLVEGKGIKYSVDWEKIKQIADNSRIDTKLFLNNLLASDMRTNTQNKKRKYFIKYVWNSQKTFAEIVSKQYCIDIKEILIEESCWIELENYPFSKYYELLGEKEKKIIEHTIENIFIEEIR